LPSGWISKLANTSANSKRSLTL